MNLTQERLKQLFRYDPNTGLFYALTRRGGGAIGRVCGNVSTRRYINLGVDGRLYRAHRLAILYMTGDHIPEGLEVDHIDGDRANNKFDNLRICSRRENGRNVKLHRDNKTGFKGVTFKNGKWEAQIKVNYKSIHLGLFKTSEEAAAAYDAAALEYHKDFARPNSIAA